MHFICESVSYQPWCSFLCPCSRHKATRNILISVFLMACDANRFPKKTQAEQPGEAYALAPLRSCCTSLSHRCGWAFGSSAHVDWQVQWSIRFCTGGVVAMIQAPEIWMKNVFPYGTMGRAVSYSISKESGPTHSIYDTSKWNALRACPTLP